MATVKFIHCSDIHLGRQRLGGKLPDSDFAQALDWIVRYTIEQKADALLIAGDLYDSPSIQPPVLQQATACLKPLQEAGVPVFAIEGNHDRATVTGESHTWYGI
ncbi:metallophosphoesterase family protein [Desulforamulus profundi]|uniref:metallophosphoesterase family protein n=1 Tax=Desulforamulus profundi TaxID=1383067 RepID=UPI001EE5B39D|nr:DNA repair exonuclease [Desulforamulus profundi]